MTEEQKQAIINKVHNVRSEKEMHDLVNSLKKTYLQQKKKGVIYPLGYMFGLEVANSWL
jgi:hypothetical protein